MQKQINLYLDLDNPSDVQIYNFLMQFGHKKSRVISLALRSVITRYGNFWDKDSLKALERVIESGAFSYGGQLPVMQPTNIVPKAPAEKAIKNKTVKRTTTHIAQVQEEKQQTVLVQNVAPESIKEMDPVSVTQDKSQKKKSIFESRKITEPESEGMSLFNNTDNQSEGMSLFSDNQTEELQQEDEPLTHNEYMAELNNLAYNVINMMVQGTEKDYPKYVFDLGRENTDSEDEFFEENCERGSTLTDFLEENHPEKKIRKMTPEEFGNRLKKDLKDRGIEEP